MKPEPKPLVWQTLTEQALDGKLDASYLVEMLDVKPEHRSVHSDWSRHYLQDAIHFYQKGDMEQFYFAFQDFFQCLARAYGSMHGERDE